MADVLEKYSLNRRQTLSGMASAFGLLAYPAIASNYPGFHEEIAQKAKNLVNGQPTVLRCLFASDASKSFVPVAAEFKKLTGIDVIYDEAHHDFDVGTQLMLQSLSGAADYDVASPASFSIVDLAAAGAIEPITELARNHEPEGYRDDVLHRTPESVEGELYAFLVEADAYTMFHNTRFHQDEALSKGYEDKFGATLDIPKTWVELDRQMAFFTRPEEGKWGGCLHRTPGYVAWEWWIRFHAKGIWPFADDMTPQIASDAGIEALEDMIAATESLHPDVFSLDYFDNWDVFHQGNVYCNLGWGGSEKIMSSKWPDFHKHIAYSPIPGGIVAGELLQLPYVNYCYVLTLPANNNFSELSYLFMLFATSPKMMTLAIQQVDGVLDPSRPIHYEDKIVREIFSANYLDNLKWSLSNAVPDLYLKDQGEYFRELNHWLHRALTHETPPKEALDSISKRWDVITKTAGHEAQIERWGKLKAQYSANARRLLKNLGAN